MDRKRKHGEAVEEKKEERKEQEKPKKEKGRNQRGKQRIGFVSKQEPKKKASVPLVSPLKSSKKGSTPCELDPNEANADGALCEDLCFKHTFRDG